MRVDNFAKLWDGSVKEWLDSSFTYLEKDELTDDYICRTIKVADVCSIKETACVRIYNNYDNLKRLIKSLYFKKDDKLISRYKRAALIIYAVIAGEDPLNYNYEVIEAIDDTSNKTGLKIDKYFLKQRFAFFLALNTLVQDYVVEESDKPIFFFSELGDAKDAEDDFLLSVYKDIFYSELYKNYNVLTMANMFGLLVERASRLHKLRAKKENK